MKEAGIREARQNLSALIAEVRKGHEVTITDRGKAVARLVPPRPADAKPFRGRAALRPRMPQLTKPLSSAILDSRAERSSSNRAGFAGHRGRGVPRCQRVGEALPAGSRARETRCVFGQLAGSDGDGVC